MEIKLNKKTELPLIVATAFLDLLGFSLFIPVLPDITAHFAESESWTMWVQSIYSIGMLATGFLIGNLSDKYGRKNLLIVTSCANILGYVLTFIGIHIGTSMGLIGFSVYLFARLIGGIGGSGFAVVQAYIADISTPASRAKNMGMVGAAFGTAFLIGPAIGGVLGTTIGIEGILMVSTAVIVINLLWIIFGLPEPHHHKEEMKEVDIEQWSISRPIIVLLIFSLFTTIGLSVVQSGSAQYTADRFGFDAHWRGYVMGIVGLGSIIYQGFLIRFVRRILSEAQMIYGGFLLVAITLSVYAMNPFPIAVFFISAIFPVGLGSINPSIASQLTRYAGFHAGRVMGLNTSMAGIGGIIGPLFVGWLYEYHINLPFFASSGLFFILWMAGYIYFTSFIRKEKIPLATTEEGQKPENSYTPMH